MSSSQLKTDQHISESNMFIAEMLKTQFSMAETRKRPTFTDTIVMDSFVLGYVFGFADEASRHFNGKHHLSRGNDYVESIFSSIILNKDVAETMCMFARQQFGDLVFTKGYRKAVRDLYAWCSSDAAYVPVSLADHLGNKGGSALRHD